MARNLQQRPNPISDMVRAGPFPGIEDFLREFSMAPVMRGIEQAPRMKVDVEETDNAYILRAEVPGADKEDITVSIDRNTVSIRANVEQQMSDQKGSMIRSERIFGEEFRTFTFPQEVDDASAEAKVENGILVLTLPKKTGAGGKKLTIQ
jgi:HSP20 family protein